MAPQEPEWVEIAAKIQRMLEAYADRLTEQASEGVRHYLAHDEYEMALEGLCLELLQLSSFSEADRRECQVLGRQLGLDRASVFDAEFWKKLVRESAGASATRGTP